MVRRDHLTPPPKWHPRSFLNHGGTVCVECRRASISLHTRRFATVVCLVALLLASAQHAKADQPPLLKLPIGPVVVASEKVPLTQALQAASVAVLDGYVLFGVEVHLKDGKEPAVKLKLEQGGVLGDALSQIFSQLPDYRFEVLSDHLISVYPNGAKDDADDLLNLRVPRFDVAAERSGVILTWPERFISELKRRLTPSQKNEPGKIYVDLYVGAVAGGPLLDLHLVNLTVREILDETSKATERFGFDEAPTGWIYSFQSQPASPVGGVHTWRVFLTLPSNWLEQARKSGHTPSP